MLEYCSAPGYVWGVADMPERLGTAPRRAVGTRQTMKALGAGRVEVVFLAKDAESRVVEPVERLCRERGVAFVYVDSMVELGRHCGINVGAATAAILRGGASTP